MAIVRVAITFAGIVLMLIGFNINAEASQTAWLDDSVITLGKATLFIGFVLACFAWIPGETKKKKRSTETSSAKEAPQASVGLHNDREQTAAVQDELEEEYIDHLVDDGEFSAY